MNNNKGIAKLTCPHCKKTMYQILSLWNEKIKTRLFKNFPKQFAIEQNLFSGNYYIIRTYSAGVFAGEIVSKNGKEVVAKNVRRIWYWAGAASLSQLAMEGTKSPEKCKFPCETKIEVLTEVIEIIECTKKAKESIKNVPVWSKK